MTPKTPEQIKELEAIQRGLDLCDLLKKEEIDMGKIKSLIDADCDFNVWTDDDGDYKDNTPLEIACLWDHIEALALILQHYPQGARAYNSPLFMADSAEAMDLLVKAGADIDICPIDGRSLFHEMTNSISCMTYVASQSLKNIDKKDKDGITPLMVCVEGLKIRHIKLLIEKGANPFIKDNQGRTARDRVSLYLVGKQLPANLQNGLEGRKEEMRELLLQAEYDYLAKPLQQTYTPSTGRAKLARRNPSP